MFIQGILKRLTGETWHLHAIGTLDLSDNTVGRDISHQGGQNISVLHFACRVMKELCQRVLGICAKRIEKARSAEVKQVLSRKVELIEVTRKEMYAPAAGLLCYLHLN
jgi:hypothetical protein